MKKEIEKKIDNYLNNHISSSLLEILSQKKSIRKYTFSSSKIKALEIAFKRQIDEKK